MQMPGHILQVNEVEPLVASKAAELRIRNQKYCECHNKLSLWASFIRTADKEQDT